MLGSSHLSIVHLIIMVIGRTFILLAGLTMLRTTVQVHSFWIPDFGYTVECGE